jgi:DNA primase
MNVDYVVSKYGLYYCDSGRYSRRIIMPIRQPDGTLVYFTNRSICDNRKKNIFPPDTSSTDYVYGLFEAIGPKKVLIFEGPFEVFQIKSFLIKNDLDYGCVSIMGTNMTEERSILLTEFFEEAFLIFDGDDAGRNGSVNAMKIMRDFMKVKNLTEFVYPGKDPATCNEDQIRKILEHV